MRRHPTQEGFGMTSSKAMILAVCEHCKHKQPVNVWTAVNATLDMEDPPIILFNTVTSPYAAGIAAASC